MVGNLLQTNCW